MHTMNSISPNDDDVVSMPLSGSGVMKNQTFQISEFVLAIRGLCFQAMNLPDAWFYLGVPCKFLQPDGGGWKKGKLRFRLEFIPDDQPPPTPPQPLDAFRE